MSDRNARVVLFYGLAALAWFVTGASGDPLPVQNDAAAPRLDRYGDPLPSGAVARLGTRRWSHRDPVQFVQFTPDGKAVISGSQNYWLGYWDVDTRDRRQDSIAVAKHIDFDGGRPFALSRNGRRFASRQGKYTVVVRDLQTGGVAARLVGLAEPVGAIALSADGSVLAWAGENEGLGIWHVSNRARLRELVGHAGAVSALAFTPDGKTLVSGGADGTIRSWSILSGAETHRLEAAKPVLDIVLCPEGKHLVYVTEDGLHVQGTANHRLLWRDPLRSFTIAFSPDGNLLAHADWEVIHVRDLGTGRQLRRLEGHHASVNALAFSPDSKTLASGGVDYAVRLWDVASGQQHFPDTRNFGRGMAAYFRADGKTLAVRNATWVLSSWNDRIWFWDAKKAVELHSFQAGFAPITHARRAGSPAVESHALSPDGTRIAQVMSDGEVRVLAVPSGKVLHRLPAKMPVHRQLALSPDNKLLAAATVIPVEAGLRQITPVSVDLRVVDLASGKTVWDFKSQPWRAVSNYHQLSVAFSADSQFVTGWFSFAKGFDFDVVTGACQVFDPPVALLSSDTAGQKLVITPLEGKSADDPKHLYLIMEAFPGMAVSPTDKARTVASFILPEKGVEHVVVDNRIVASAWDATIRLGSIPTGKELATFKLPMSKVGRTFSDLTEKRGHMIVSLDASADGRLLVSSHFDGTGLVWDLTPYHAKARLGAVPLNERRLEQLWTDLADADAAKAWQSIWTLAEQPDASMKLLQARLKPETAPAADEAARLLRDLGAADFQVRQRAMTAIRDHNRRMSHMLRAALAKPDSLEVERRLRLLLDEFAKPEPVTPERLRQWRALEVLEQINTPAARDVAQSLARGAPEAWLTRQAKAALLRLDRRVSP